MPQNWNWILATRESDSAAFDFSNAVTLDASLKRLGLMSGSISRDGKQFVYVSGGTSIRTVPFNPVTGEVGNPETVLNTSSWTEGPEMADDGLAIVYQNGVDANISLYMMTRETLDAEWSSPVRLPRSINSALAARPTLAADYSSIYFISSIE